MYSKRSPSWSVALALSQRFTVKGPIDAAQQLSWVDLERHQSHILQLVAVFLGWSLSWMECKPASHVFMVLSLLTVVNRIQDYEILQRSIASEHRAKYLIISPSAWCKARGKVCGTGGRKRIGC